MNVRPLTILIASLLAAIPVTAGAGPAGFNMCLNILMRPTGPAMESQVAQPICTCVIDDLSRDYSDGQQDLFFRGYYFGKEVDGDSAFRNRFEAARTKCGD